MDPLSIVASVTGILTVAAKISQVASNLVSAYGEAPPALQGIVVEMSGLSACLNELLPFLDRKDAASKSQMMSVSVKQMVIIASSCVLAISELQKILDGFGNSKSLSTRTRLRWVSNEKRVITLRSRIQMSISSLNLMLNIFSW